MRPTDPDERRRVRVHYVSRGYGLALAISDDTAADDPGADDPSALRQAAANDVSIEEDTADVDHAEVETDDGYLTVVASGVTTLELRRPDGESSMLIWDEAEVAWESLRSG